MFGDGNERYIAFYRGTYKYLYYERSIYGRPEAGGRVQNGVAIVKDGKTIQYLSCSAMSDGLSGPKSRPFILPDFFVDEAFTAF